jgi:hypothetical protein
MMKKTQKPEMKKQTQTEAALNKELLKIEKAFATNLRAGNCCKSSACKKPDEV